MDCVTLSPHPMAAQSSKIAMANFMAGLLSRYYAWPAAVFLARETRHQPYVLKLKIAISVLVTLLTAFAAAAAGGAFVSAGLTVSASTVAILQSIAGFVAVLGVSPYQFNPPIPAYLSAAGLVLASIQAAHFASLPAGSPHSAAWVVFGCLSVLVSMLGKSPLPHVPAAQPGDTVQKP